MDSNIEKGQRNDQNFHKLKAYIGSDKKSISLKCQSISARQPSESDRMLYLRNEMASRKPHQMRSVDAKKSKNSDKLLIMSIPGVPLDRAAERAGNIEEEKKAGGGAVDENNKIVKAPKSRREFRRPSNNLLDCKNVDSSSDEAPGGGEYQQEERK